MIGTLLIVALGGILYRLGYLAGRDAGAQYYREQEAERVTRTGAT